MIYVRRDLTDGKTIIDKALLDHMQDGIIEGISKAEALEKKVDDIASKNLETDSTLTKEGFAADAKAVGEAIANINISTELDTTLTQSGKAADAGAVGAEFNRLGQVIAQSTIKVDGTLTQAGQAADAKTVGDLIDGINTTISNMQIPEVVTNLEVQETGKVPDASVVAKAITDVQSSIPQIIGDLESAQPGTVPDAVVVAETIKTVQSAIPPVTTTLEVEDPEAVVPAVKVVVEAIETAKSEVVETVKKDTVETVKAEVVSVVKTEVKDEVITTVKEEITTTGVKNPAAITFTGAVTGTYDGSEALTINIPEGGGGDSNMEAITNEQINELVNLV